MQTLKIYALVCPISRKIKYVGKTKKDLDDRLKQHIGQSYNGNALKAFWIKSLKTKGLKPIIIILEETKDLNNKDIEKKWIVVFDDLKCDLFNINSGI